MKKKIFAAIMALLLMVSSLYGNVNVTEVTAATEAENLIEIDEAHFPDAVFRDYLTNTYDGNKDGKINPDSVTSIDFWRYAINSLKDLTGIEYFSKLSTLYCGHQKLKKLDLSNNKALTKLDCSYNELSSLDVSKSTALTDLDCRYNQLTSLDVSNNTALTKLDCYCNKLSSLDVSKNTALTSLNCSTNEVSSLDVSGNTALTSLDCSFNELSSLNVSKNTALTSLNCSYNELSSLDVSKNTVLTDLNCYCNELSSLNVSKNTTLTRLYCQDNQLSSLDVNKNTALTNLNCEKNQLISLDVSNNTALALLVCGWNQLSSLDVSRNTSLTRLSCEYNQLSTLDVSKNTALTDLSCDFDNNMKEINLSDIVLKRLDLYNSSQIANLSKIKGADFDAVEDDRFNKETKEIDIARLRLLKIENEGKLSVEYQWIDEESKLPPSGLPFNINFFVNEVLTPIEPQTPTEPENPDNPQNPTDPQTPDNPQNPTDPQNPDTPQTPTDPQNPDTPQNPEDTKPVPSVTVSYRTHVQTIGWQAYVSNGAMAGTSGLAKRLEGINIQVNGNSNLGIQYTTHVQSYGWLPWASNDDMSGTEGEAKRLEAIKIQLTGADKDKYDVYYRVHAQSYGWLSWAMNGAPAGTAGYAKRLEAIQILVVKKGEKIDQNQGGITSARSEAYIALAGSSPVVGAPATSNTDPTIGGAANPNVSYRTHVQSFGWQGWKYNGQMSGTSGQAKRLEGINIKLMNKPYSGGICYTTHVQSYGWQGDINNSATWKKDGEMAGTSGQAKRLEAIMIKLTGEMADHYDVYYRVHAQSYGWLGWAKNGDPAGTAGYAKRLEGIQIVLVPKGGAAPANNYGGINSTNGQAYIAK